MNETILNKIESLKELLSKMSYLNAAEGASYFNETPIRKTTERSIERVGLDLLNEGIDIESIFFDGNYLMNDVLITKILDNKGEE